MQTSLSLLKTYALKELFKLDILVDQKLINKKDVNPIISHPRNITKKLPLITKITMLITNELMNNNNLSTLASYLK
jgi:hypothetical protein